MTDKFITSGEFDLQQCPDLTNLLEAVADANSTEPVFSCSESCVTLFEKLGESCSTDLQSAFRTADPPIGDYSVKFFDACDITRAAMSPGMAPVEVPVAPVSNTKVRA